MQYREVLKVLESLGTEQNRKVYRRHGSGEQVHGVSFADLDRLAKKIKVDHELALRLWETGFYEARMLAIKIADPERIDMGFLEAWVNDVDNYVLADMLAGLTGRTRFAQRKMVQWTRSEKEWVGRSGWQVLAHLALHDNTLPEGFFDEYLSIIEQRIHTAKNRVRDAMNTALIAIGIRTSQLESLALAAAARIGKVEVDHGETSCKTPDAAAYIQKTLARRQKAGAKA